MITVLVGDTDRRPVLYTLIKLFQKLGDTCVISSDRHLRRLIEDGGDVGYYQNTLIIVSDESPAEIFEMQSIERADFEYIIYDGITPTEWDLAIHIKGCNTSQMTQDLLDMMDEIEEICLEYGKNSIPYTLNMFKKVEEVEGYRVLQEIDKKVTKRLAKVLENRIKLPARNIRKVVSSK